MVDGLAGQRVHADLGCTYRGLFHIAVETQDLASLCGILHHLQVGKRHPNFNPRLKESRRGRPLPALGICFFFFFGFLQEPIVFMRSRRVLKTMKIVSPCCKYIQ